MLIHVPLEKKKSSLHFSSRRVQLVTAHQPCLPSIVASKLRRLKLVGLLGAGAGPLVAGSVGEFVAVGRDEVVEDGGSTGACQILLACLIFKISDFKASCLP
jgi:hypothetical protein